MASWLVWPPVKVIVVLLKVVPGGGEAIAAGKAPVLLDPLLELPPELPPLLLELPPELPPLLPLVVTCISLEGRLSFPEESKAVVMNL